MRKIIDNSSRRQIHTEKSNKQTNINLTNMVNIEDCRARFEIERCQTPKLKSISNWQCSVNNISPLNQDMTDQYTNSSNHESSVMKKREALNILVVEDNLISQKVVNLMLIELGYKNINIVSTGHSAIELISKNDYNFLLLDIGLPDFTGFDICKIARKLINYQHVPIIALTAFSRDEIEKKAISSGITDILNKPIFMDDLKNIINAYL